MVAASRGVKKKEMNLRVAPKTLIHVSRVVVCQLGWIVPALVSQQ